MSRSRLITFLSDFGTREYYTGSVKGAILTINPQAQVVDISHEASSHDLLEGAFTLLCSYYCFPPGTIHLAVVDPEVGSNRRGLIAVAQDYTFVAPDNGLLSLVEGQEPFSLLVSIEAEQYFRAPVSRTFHARDIFGPVAAWLSRGKRAEDFGPAIEDPVRLRLPSARRLEPNRMEGIILHIDKFGNAITNLSPGGVRKLMGAGRTPAAFKLESAVVDTHLEFYSQGEPGKPFSLIGSSGFYEIAVRTQSAARLLGLERGMKVELVVR